MTRLILTIAVVVGSGLAGQTDEQEIRQARARFNTAIAAHDTAAIDREWTDDIEVRTSRGATVRGRTEYRTLFVQQMTRFPDQRYTRMPDKITVHRGWGTASERGRWIGQWTDGSQSIEVTGYYLGQWRQTDRGWRLSGEFFVAERCNGADYCNRR